MAPVVHWYNLLNGMVHLKYFSFYRFHISVDSQAIDTNAKIDEKTMKGLKELGLLGQQIPEEYGMTVMIA